MVDPERERFVEAFSQPARRDPRHRPDRLGQDDDALRRAADAAHAGEEHHHDRGPGRVRAHRHQADAGQHRRPACTFATRPALDDARRPRRDHGRRDPRQARPRRSPSRPRSPATSCSPRCTPTTRRARSRASSRWASSPSSSPAPSTASSPSASRAGCARRARSRWRVDGRHRCASTASTSTTDEVHVFEPGGCARCGGTGYKGRIGLYEVMVVTEEIRQLAIAPRLGRRDRRGGAPRRACAACATRASRRSAPGMTSFAELARVTG